MFNEIQDICGPYGRGRGVKLCSKGLKKIWHVFGEVGGAGEGGEDGFGEWVENAAE